VKTQEVIRGARMKDNDLNKEELLDVLKMTVDGRGWFPRNRAIYHFTEELTGKYFYSKKELFDSIKSYIVENDIQRRNGTTLGTHYTNIVYYYLSNLVRKERNRDKLFTLLSSFDRIGVGGDFYNRIIDNYTDNVTPESDLIEKQFIESIRDYFSLLELDCLMGFSTRKESAEKAGYNYEYYCKKINHKLAQIRKYLKQQGYEKEDFINIEKKRPLLVPSTHYVHIEDDTEGRNS
jgi:hypothetical protein